LNTSKEDGGRTTSKGDEGQSHLAEVKFRRENLGLFRRSCPGATSSRNSLWRIHEIARTIGSRRVAEKLSVGSNRDLLVIDPMESAISEFGV
jgi:hypothetical protein